MPGAAAQRQPWTRKQASRCAQRAWVLSAGGWGGSGAVVTLRRSLRRTLLSVATRRELAAALEQAFAELGSPLKPGAAKLLIDDRIASVAAQLGCSLQTAVRYCDVEGMADLARNTVRGLKEHEAAEDALPAVVIRPEDIALFVPVFAVTARLALVNGDRDMAADLCETVATIGLSLRKPPASVSTGLLRKAVRQARTARDSLELGFWVADPDGPGGMPFDTHLAAELGLDLDAAAARVGLVR